MGDANAPHIIESDKDDDEEMATNSIKLLTGNSHPQLAKLVADR